MCKFVNNAKHSRIDKCMKNLIKNLNLYTNLNIKACCCGHNKYPMSIIINFDEEMIDLFSGKIIPRTRNFYIKDKKGYYFIPEVVKK